MSESKTDTASENQSAAAGKVAVEMSAERNIGKPLLRCCFDPADRYIYSAGQHRNIWRVPLAEDSTGENITELAGHDGWVLALAASSDGNTLVSGGSDGQLIWWSPEGNEPKIRKQLEAHDGWVRDIAFSPDEKWLATGGNDGTVKVWDAQSSELLQTFEGHAHQVYRIAFHPDGKQLVSGDLTCRIQCWDLESGKSARELHTPSLHRIDKNHNLHLGGTRGLCFDAGGKYLAVSGLRAAPNYLGGNVQPGNVILDFVQGKVHKEQKTKGDIETVPWESFFIDGDTLAVAMGGKAGGYLVFWNLDKEHEFHFHKFPDVARDLAFDRKRNRIATAHEDGKLRVSHLKIG